MRKPDWNHAPEWAKWAGQDADSNWYFYELKPLLDNKEGDWYMGDKKGRMGQVEYTLLAYPILEKRP